jgi:hypothetical protein
MMHSTLATLGTLGRGGIVKPPEELVGFAENVYTVVKIT